MANPLLKARQIADAQIDNIKLAIGAAATNIGTLGGVLTGTLPNPSIGNNQITSTMIAAGAVRSSELASGASAANIGAGGVTSAMLAASSVSSVVYHQSFTTDFWSNVALSAGTNGFSGLPPIITFTGGYAIVLLTASVMADGPTLPGQNYMGWDLAFQNVLYQRLSRIYTPSAVLSLVSVDSAIYIPGPLNGGLQIGPTFYTSNAVPNKMYLRCTGAPNSEWMRMTVIEVKK